MKKARKTEVDLYLQEYLDQKDKRTYLYMIDAVGHIEVHYGEFHSPDGWGTSAYLAEDIRENVSAISTFTYIGSL